MTKKELIKELEVKSIKIDLSSMPENLHISSYKLQTNKNGEPELIVNSPDMIFSIKERGN